MHPLRAVPSLMLATAVFGGVAGFVRAEDKPASARVKPASENPEPLPDNLTDALGAARNANHDVIVVFNVSDWGGWCARIREDFLEKPEFKAAVRDDFEIVGLDFPRNRESIGAKELRANTAYAAHYDIRGFPILLLLDKNGRAYARTGYREGGVADFARHLKDLRDMRRRRDAMIAKASRNKGDIKADLLSRALRMVDGSLVSEYAKEFEELRAADPSDRRGVLLDYDINLLLLRAENAARIEHNKAVGLREFDDFLAAHPAMPPEKRQRVAHHRFAYLGDERVDGLSGTKRAESRIRELKTMLALAPKSAIADEIRARLESEQAEWRRLLTESDSPGVPALAPAR